MMKNLFYWFSRGCKSGLEHGWDARLPGMLQILGHLNAIAGISEIDLGKYFHWIPKVL
jgi:hypothetical protein